MEEIKKEFGQIYDDNIDKVYRFVFLKVNSKEIAEDLTSEAFAKTWDIFRDRYSKNKPLSNPKAFCYRTARNLVIDHYRKKARRNFISTDSVSIPDNSQSLEDKINVDSDMEMIMKAIKKIKGNYQDIIIWHYLDELSIPEISEITNKSENSIRVTLHRALDSLKNVLEA